MQFAPIPNFSDPLEKYFEQSDELLSRISYLNRISANLNPAAIFAEYTSDVLAYLPKHLVPLRAYPALHEEHTVKLEQALHLDEQGLHISSSKYLPPLQDKQNENTPEHVKQVFPQLSQ